MKPTKSDVARQFDRMSHAYAESVGHATGDDLAIVVAYARLRPDMRVLDVATGAGHTAAAIAPFVAQVVAIDIAPGMLARTSELAAKRGLTNVETALMDVESLDFPAASFDVVTCRIAPHHFLDIDRAIGEIARVVRPGGAFVVEDSIVPDDPALDRFMNDVEKIRDATHVRSLTLAQWRTKLESAGLAPVQWTSCPKTHDIAEWVARSGMDAAGAARVDDAFARASAQARREFSIEERDGRAVRFTDAKAVVRAEKARSSSR